MVNSKHDLLVERVSNELRACGYSVANEIPVSEGRGAVDISCSDKVRAIFHAEVKDSPTSINKKRVRRQLELYRSFFGEEADYVLISPDANGQVMFQNFAGFRGNIQEYLSFLG